MNKTIVRSVLAALAVVPVIALGGTAQANPVVLQPQQEVPAVLHVHEANLFCTFIGPLIPAACTGLDGWGWTLS